MKKILLVLIVLFPVFANAKCDTNKNSEYIKTIAPQITYDNQFDHNTKLYTFTIYNVPNGFYVVWNNRKFTPDSDGKVVFRNVKQGTNISISIYASSECEAIKYIGKTEDYLNPFYNSVDCLGYEDKITYCAYEFTSSIVTKETIETAKYYYDHSYTQEPDSGEKEEELSFLDLLKLYISKWWVKVTLSVVTTIICISIYSVKYRKIKHGI
jgi:hypothetical protein